jgi:dihydrolipoamide dehydrogenase
MAMIDIQVPDIGDFDEVAVIELLVKPGDTVKAEQSLITVESDKASMEIPSSHAGVVKELKVKLGDKVKQGSVVLVLEGEGAASAPARAAAAPQRLHRRPLLLLPPRRSWPPRRQLRRLADIECDLLVLGAGPGGYSAAFRAADLGLKVVLVERYAQLGGVCLNVGCIPSKALLHVAAVMDEVSHMADLGVDFGAPTVNIDKLRGHKEKVINKLTGGLAAMAKMRKVTTVRGYGAFVGPNHVEVEETTGTGQEKTGKQEGDGVQEVHHRRRLAGGAPALHARRSARGRQHRRAGAQGSAQAHADPGRRHHRPGNGHGLQHAGRPPGRGGNAGRPDAGRRPRPGQDLAEDERQALRQHHAQDQDGGRQGHARRHRGDVRERRRGRHAPAPQVYDLVLQAVGRTPNGKKIAADKAGVAVTDRGFINVDIQMRTNVPHIFAIGDIVGQPMLAHKAVHEAHVAAEVIAGELQGNKELAAAAFNARVIPSVAYTDPEVAWVGLTEDQAKAQGIKVKKGLFPWTASGRAIANGRDEGVTKLLFDDSPRPMATARSWAAAWWARTRAT